MDDPEVDDGEYDDEAHAYLQEQAKSCAKSGAYAYPIFCTSCDRHLVIRAVAFVAPSLMAEAIHGVGWEYRLIYKPEIEHVCMYLMCRSCLKQERIRSAEVN